MIDAVIQIPATEGLHLILVRDGHYSTVCIDPTLLKEIDSRSEKVLRELEAGIKRSVE